MIYLIIEAILNLMKYSVCYSPKIAQLVVGFVNYYYSDGILWDPK